MNLSMTSGAKAVADATSEKVAILPQLFQNTTNGRTRKLRRHFVSIVPWIC